jgi:multidrug efflux pump subunit AcrA (membrane-fusion protein)
MFHAGSVAWASMQDRAFKRLCLAVPIGAVVLCALVACGGAHTHRGRTGAGGPVAIPLATAAPATVRPTAQIAGIIAPYQNVSISSSLSEPTDAVNVIQGDQVHRGEILAVLDTADLQANYESDERNAASADARATQTKYQARLNLGQGNNQVQSALAAMNNAKLVYKQDSDLYKSGYVSESDLESARAAYVQDAQNYNTAVLNAQVNGNNTQGLQAATVASALADAQSAHAQADQVEAQIVRATITSPVDGVVVNRNLNPGEYPGSRTIFTVQQLDPVYAELNASSNNVFAIKRGSLVAVSVAGISTAGTYRGRVNAVLGQVQPGSTNFTVECIVPNPGERLQAGMAVTATIDLPSTSGVGIPTAAFLDDSHSSVMVVGADGTAKQTTLRELASDGKTSIVSGISGGTKVVANGQLGITDGQQVVTLGSPSPGASGAPAPGASGGGGRRHRRGAAPSASASPQQ